MSDPATLAREVQIAYLTAMRSTLRQGQYENFALLLAQSEAVRELVTSTEPEPAAQPQEEPDVGNGDFDYQRARF